MKFIPTPLAGSFVLELERREDERGYFARSFCLNEFKTHGLDFSIVQSNVARTLKKGTVRGLHYQIPPSREAKLMRCTQGAVFDVIVDLRPDSTTYGKHFGIELTQDNGRALFVPPMFGHGYQSLEDNSEVTYLVSDFYNPGCERGLRHDDPAFNITWPLAVSSISDKDRMWPLFNR
jgi:dTDP-4-dehydrorhamnose 3,5-epimerase